MNNMPPLYYPPYIVGPSLHTNRFQFGGFSVDPSEVFLILKKEFHIQKNASSETDLQLLADVIQLSCKELAECDGSPFDLPTLNDVHLFLADEIGRHLRPRFQFGRFTLDPKKIFRLLEANYGIEKKASSATDLQFLQDTIQQCLQERAKWGGGVPGLPTLDEAHRFLVAEIAYQKRQEEICTRALQVLSQLGYVNYRMNPSYLEHTILEHPGIEQINAVLMLIFRDFQIVSEITRTVVEDCQNLKFIVREEVCEPREALKKEQAERADEKLKKEALEQSQETVKHFQLDVENVVKAAIYDLLQ